MRFSKKSALHGGTYHIALIFICGMAFNWGFAHLTGVDIAGRIFAGVQIPEIATAVILCASAVIVLWNNWID